MNFSDSTDARVEAALNRAAVSAVLVREAGVPFQPPLGYAAQVDPITDWLSLMEVVQMLCPVWPVRDRPMLGDHWRI
jgi:hypothetical protein